MKQRDAILIVDAGQGDRKAAYSLIRRSIKAAGLKVKAFIPAYKNKSCGIGDARFITEGTHKEIINLQVIGSKLAFKEGWHEFPADLYHH